ncbi:MULTISPECIES: hypothetical protein [unclassified Brevibacterium]|uniref:hypothetical protein n=1 Tax=unclassified Brevibacterium TaxID=2614124 RepID=UPI00107FF704|nr:hypothetical protein [Brevibacterium sp. S111]
MRTGTTRPHRRPALLFVALFAALSLLSLAGCAGSSPVAVPTSTLPEEQSDDSSTDGTAEVEVPEYETDLDLSEEEKEAVDGALVAFVGYIKTINRVFSSGGTDMKGIDTFAAKDSLRSLKDSANGLKKEDKYMAGEYDYYNLRIHETTLDSKSPEKDSVKILFCSHDSKHAVVKTGKSMPSQTSKSLTILQTASKHGGKWKISNQELWSEKCE